MSSVINERAVAYDAARDAVLRREGYSILRVTNADVMRNIEGVLTMN